MKTAIILGTRPEIIKLSLLMKKLNPKNSSIIFTGQHYDYELSKRFIKELGIRKPDYWLKLSKSNPAIQIGEIILKLPTILKNISPDTVIVQGDTNTVLAGGITTLKCGIPLSHVESGLRSFDWRMPEEHNRIEIDHISELLFAATLQNKKNLLNENVHGKIFVTGNTVIDAINHYAKITSKKSQINIPKNDYVLMTLHRTENVDNKKTLTGLIKGILESKTNIVFPVHPHTLKRLQQFGLYQKLQRTKTIHMIKSVGYFDIIELMKNCSFIITDSGGLQEEATASKIRKKTLVLRKSTDRPEAVAAGLSELVGTNSAKITNAINRTSRNPQIPSKKTPFGKGNSTKQILKIIKKTF